GDKIQASVRKALLPRFENKIKEGSSYNFKSIGVASNTGAFRTMKHQFKLNLQNDVIGILSFVGRERVYEKNRVATEFKVIELECNE
ncbi:hypothetical protein RYX36_007801, partial [Vicia faba]